MSYIQQTMVNYCLSSIVDYILVIICYVLSNIYDIFSFASFSYMAMYRLVFYCGLQEFNWILIVYLHYFFALKESRRCQHRKNSKHKIYFFDICIFCLLLLFVFGKQELAELSFLNQILTCVSCKPKISFFIYTL